ncbi:MAG: hypothetical protein KJN76_04970, partial [Eudoraea sp.]|nr:hypothetical protein [Eudoraea sp.]
VWLIKINDAGDLLWERTFGGAGFDAARSVSPTADGGFVISGNSRSKDLATLRNAGENDMWVLKTDKDGNMEWQANLGGSGIDAAYDAIEDNQQRILVVGSSPSLDFPMIQNKGQEDLIIFRLE